MKKITIGKSSSNDIVVSDDPTVSRYHAFLFTDNNHINISDCNSTNGTYVNGERIFNDRLLNKLDVLTVGNTILDWTIYFKNNKQNKMNKEENNYYTQYDTPLKEISNENYFHALGLSLYLIVIKIFIMPLNVVKKSISNLPKQQDLKTEFILLYYIKQVYDSIIILFWPLSILYLFYIVIEAQAFPDFEAVSIFLVMSYFSPLWIALIKELLSLVLIIVMKLEEIARNTRRD